MIRDALVRSPRVFRLVGPLAALVLASCSPGRSTGATGSQQSSLDPSGEVVESGESVPRPGDPPWFANLGSGSVDGLELRLVVTATEVVPSRFLPPRDDPRLMARCGWDVPQPRDDGSPPPLEVLRPRVCIELGASGLDGGVPLDLELRATGGVPVVVPLSPGHSLRLRVGGSSEIEPRPCSTPFLDRFSTDEIVRVEPGQPVRVPMRLFLRNAPPQGPLWVVAELAPTGRGAGGDSRMLLCPGAPDGRGAESAECRALAANQTPCADGTPDGRTTNSVGCRRLGEEDLHSLYGVSSVWGRCRCSSTQRAWACPPMVCPDARVYSEPVEIRVVPPGATNGPDG